MIDALTLDQMRTFVVVAESGGFRSASMRLSRAQSAVSHAIANLEAQLGVSLFDRTGHRPVLTPEGQALLVNARDVLLRVDAMRARARGMGEGVELELSLIVDVLFPLATVGAALKEMRSVYPSVAVRLAVSPMGGPLDGLINRRFTLGIMAGEEFADPAISRRALAEIQMIAVVAAEHPLGLNRPSATLDSPDLADHLQIVLSDPSQRSEGRDFGVLSPQTCRVSNQDAKYSLILEGLGWGRLPEWQVERDLAEGRLVRLPTDSLGRDSRLPMEAYLVHRIDEPLGPAARTFGDALSRLCGA
ncbi:LysR family transcriptional regulator [Ensifer adhaerens]|uniref:LysR family transcriptional regulator n=1 Tax=Ensifer adhaerens TaxID=106592 RepID=UPI001CBAF98A|nr:LysR family transcriptional regulator [Ensifer adhaerens]MBZ7921482.1 LysR family transcriptional regulator [Ensifer adhaerens]MBZ7921492.1 LysR family transcriptional regulator [Ensifer adhaerens]UAX93907.1 LysR family transcriptional regulator [Ensifer adhaerens]UAX93918.1 LysR family transcriptional regulator [Ensifer adhaerens]UAY01542.1 LysR family transcriptional regulator [Ensifer adhaerens]